MARKKSNNIPVSTKPTKPTPTKQYYFAMRGGVYFGTDERYVLFRDMSRHKFEEIEEEAKRRNRQSRFVAPVDDDYTEEEE